MSSVFIWLKGLFGISSVASPGNFKELTLFLAFSNISSILSWRVLLNIKLVSLFWKSSWVSTFTASSTTRPGVGFTISSINASLFASAIPVAVSKSVWLIVNAVYKKFSFCSS